MEKVQCGSLKRRDPRRAPITDYAEDLESLLSLTEEEEGSGSQLFSFQEVQSPLQNFSMSVPSLCFTPSERHPSLTKNRPHSHAQAHSSLSSLLGGSTQRRLDTLLKSRDVGITNQLPGDNQAQKTGQRAVVFPFLLLTEHLSHLTCTHQRGCVRKTTLPGDTKEGDEWK
ncbi:rho guanine nucleotide exchange factor 2 isoform X1, partial [Tachysurus ichikawai]